MKVEAIKHKDIRDKEQLYLKISNTEGGQVIINVGIKTFTAVKTLAEIEAKKGGGK